MEKLIEAYLLHTKHYDADKLIQRVDAFVLYDEQHYRVTFVDDWYDGVNISNSELLTFLYERIL